MTLVGIPAVKGFNQSRELLEEADGVVVFDRIEIASVLSHRPETAPSPPSDGVASAAAPSESAADAGRIFAADWVRTATPADASALRALFPRIPRHLDIELLQFAESFVCRSLRGDDEAHRAVRAAFWAFIHSADTG